MVPWFSSAWSSPGVRGVSESESEEEEDEVWACCSAFDVSEVVVAEDGELEWEDESERDDAI